VKLRGGAEAIRRVRGDSGEKKWGITVWTLLEEEKGEESADQRTGEKNNELLKIWGLEKNRYGGASLLVWEGWKEGQRAGRRGEQKCCEL